jgi:hypothetical protein
MGVAGEDGTAESGFAGAGATAAVCGGRTSLAGFMKNHTAPAAGNSGGDHENPPRRRRTAATL